jgi:RNA polymerase sigma factor (TIGR02999 family)
MFVPLVGPISFVGKGMEHNDITGMLRRWGAGEKESLDQIIPALYAQLRSLAHHRLRGAPGERSLNTTGLVHEAYLRLVESAGTSFQNREHFLAIASRVMRNVLVDSARARTADKRGGGAALDELHEETWVADVDLDRVTELDEALTRLEQLDERQALMVEQRYFGGLTLEEIAAATNLSLATVKRDLRSARAWLAAELRAE